MDVAIDNCNYSIEKYLLTDEQDKLRQELYDVLCNIDVDKSNISSLSKGLGELKKFLNRYKDIQILKRVLNLHDNQGRLAILKAVKNIYHNDETLYKEAERLLLEAGAIGYKEKEHLPKSVILWENLISNQQKNLEKFFQ